MARVLVGLNRRREASAVCDRALASKSNLWDAKTLRERLQKAQGQP